RGKLLGRSIRLQHGVAVPVHDVSIPIPASGYQWKTPFILKNSPANTHGHHANRLLNNPGSCPYYKARTGP
ncbi:MAG: hypothetical protein OXG56_11250, partial [Gammaproteobacteria bacterium]|nr:hypothetical protein [Gammaproteobacteria bacterium]